MNLFIIVLEYPGKLERKEGERELNLTENVRPRVNRRGEVKRTRGEGEGVGRRRRPEIVRYFVRHTATYRV